MKLEIKPLSQRDSLWANKKLGSSTVSTIGDYGCLLVCHAMMLTYYGHDFHPDDLNEFYKTRKVFDSATMINYYAAANCFEDISADDYVDCYIDPAPLDRIDKYLAEGKPVIALVDFSPKEGVQTHFVLIIGKDRDYLINDPWTGECYWFEAKYGDPARYIFGLRLYSGPVKEVVTNEALNAQIVSLHGQLSDAHKALATLQDSFSQSQREIKGYREDVENLQEENRNLVLADEKQKIQIKKLTDQYHESEVENQAVLEALTSSQADVLALMSNWELLIEVCKRITKRG